MKVVYSPAAQDDVKDIFNYIAYELQAPQAARNQVNRIRSAIKKPRKMLFCYQMNRSPLLR